MADDITLEALGQFQDRAAMYNWQNSIIVQKRLALVSDAITLATTALTSMSFADHKQHTVRALGTAAISTVATSVRVGLWGNLPESIVLLRLALETSSILADVVMFQEYKTLATEMETTKLGRHEYKRAVSRLGPLGSRIKRLWGRLSSAGAHCTGTCLKFASYQVNGNLYDRVGAALAPEFAEIALLYAPDVCLYLLESLATAYSQDSADFPEVGRLTDLKARFRMDTSWRSDGTTVEAES